VSAPSNQSLSLSSTIRHWWKENSEEHGFYATLREFALKSCEYIRESMPDRKRQRYGDVDFDWDHRVDTTAATVGWKDRLAGMFLSPYQPTEPSLFHEMMQSLGIDFFGFTFIDLGSGKGRSLLMAAEYPFKRIIGVELLPALHALALENISKHQSEACRCTVVESRCQDARQFEFPAEPIVLYLFNPLPQVGLQEVLRHLEDSLRVHRRVVYVLYHNPLLEGLLAGSPALKKISGTDQFCVYANASAAEPGHLRKQVDPDFHCS
jgi:SAM-dependent methyltransferase